MGLLDSLLKKVVSNDANDKFEESRRIDVDTNTKRYEYYGKDRNLIYYHIETYDNEGRIIHKTAYNAGGGEMGDFDITYTAEGKEKDGAWCFYNQGFLMKIERTFDDLGRMVEDHRHGSEAHRVCGNKTIYHYSGDSTTAEYTEYYSQWDELGNHNAPIYSYTKTSEDGRSVRITRYDQFKKVMDMTALEKNEQGRKILEVSADANGIVKFYDTYQHDDAGKVINHQRFDIPGQGKTIEDIVSKIVQR